MKLEQLSDVVSFTIGKNPTRIKAAIPRVPEVEHVKKTTNGKRSTSMLPVRRNWLTEPVHGYVTHCPQGGSHD